MPLQREEEAVLSFSRQFCSFLSTRSLQLVGDGNNACGFQRTVFAPLSLGCVNEGQRFTTSSVTRENSRRNRRDALRGHEENTEGFWTVSIGTVQGEFHTSPLKD